ncbi:MULTISPECIES: peroxide stress protein YaaA [Amniculibacterium]|uniref:peroxide stress protein YaaA n=1 Tax=Amniculibacterium TaxID=2715289 RepID=UPI000F590B55|nr:MULTISPECIES: peroxide stress protein YaaA [Amniculibacterium]
MKIITSPAKLMQLDYTSTVLKPSVPRFIEEASEIQSHLKEKTPQFLSELMEISPKLADENWHRNQIWNNNPKKNESCPAIFAFTGEVYRGLNAKSLNDNSLHYLQKNHRILSGLYGLLKPSDKVMLYRLEMGRKFEFDQYKNLYAFWKEKVTAQLNSEFKKNDLLLNLASNEYSKVVDKKNINAQWVDFDFYELKSGKPKTVVVYTKHARGLVARFCAETEAKSLNDVKAFNLEGYKIDEEKSSNNKLVFVR